MAHDPLSIQSLVDGRIANPFARLRTLLAGHAPGRTPTIDLSLGEPREAMPAALGTMFSEADASLAVYPAIRGSDDLRGAIADWIARRYGDDIKLDAGQDILPCNGSREGLFYACFAAAARKPVSGQPAVLMCNPYYQTYLGAALAVGAEPIFLNATDAQGFLPDLDDLSADPALLDRAIAFYLCTPTNPQGALAPEAYLKRAIQLAQRHNFMLFVDECYADIYDDVTPPGALAVALRETGACDQVVVFHSLSKRANLPGLRSGFSAGDRSFHEQLFMVRNLVGPQMPGPIQHVSTQVWNNDAHVARVRAAYRTKFDLCDVILDGKFGYQRPQAGFFLWLDMRQFGLAGEATVTLWKRFGVKVVPGAFLAQSGRDGTNPGAGYIRVALVQDRDTLQEALERLVEVFA